MQQATYDQRLYKDNKIEMLRTLRDKEEIKKYINEEDAKKKCSYKSCLIQTQLIYDRISAEYEADNNREESLKKELKARVEFASGEKRNGSKQVPQQTPRTTRDIKVTTTKRPQQVQLNKKRKNGEQDKEFNEELIRPCLCDSTWHRTCIRELIVKTESIECPFCQYQYTVGYSDCFALYNKKRPNYLGYMLFQEILFFVSLVAFALAGWFTILWWAESETSFVHTSWEVIISTLSWSIIILSCTLFGCRIKAKYSYREIEDIVIYDRSQK